MSSKVFDFFHDHFDNFSAVCRVSSVINGPVFVYLFVFVCKLLCLQTAFTFLFSLFTACVDNNPDCAGYIYENGGPQEYCNDPEPYIQEYVKQHCRKTCNIDNCKWSILVILIN